MQYPVVVFIYLVNLKARLFHIKKERSLTVEKRSLFLITIYLSN
ncbi:hypothetical protein [Floridanema aerugineum]|uniref:Uncharacterized protein n=1 Tax=Floridaenema aerugineum BLCC-F46 TaxID=3153654 RepID=A0ABV4X6Z8_9CYAN